MNFNKTKSVNETLKFLFESKKNTDVTFVIHGRELEAHKLVVTSRSSVLEAMIYNDLAPKNGKHLIGDPKITFEDFENFLQFLYTDKCEMTAENIENLLHLSIFYDVEFLTQKCVKLIKSSLNFENIMKFSEIGILYSDSCNLLDICISKLPEYIKNISFNFRENNIEKWISPELALKIVEKCPRNKNDTENQIFKKVYEWATKITDEQNVLTENVKMILEPFLPFIKFEDLEPITLATIVKDDNLLDPEHFSDIICKAVKRYNEGLTAILLEWKKPSTIKRLVASSIPASDYRQYRLSHDLSDLERSFLLKFVFLDTLRRSNDFWEFWLLITENRKFGVPHVARYEKFFCCYRTKSLINLLLLRQYLDG
uniref:BTB domain-containing protein n=1 Tax=Panagrolaimus davidi TaxID=227884 RepID=A0A914PJJ5_9BILA